MIKVSSQNYIHSPVSTWFCQCGGLSVMPLLWLSELMTAEEHRKPCLLNFRYHIITSFYKTGNRYSTFHNFKLYTRSLYKTYWSDVILKCFNLCHSLLSSYDIAPKCLNSPFCFHTKKNLWKIAFLNGIMT